MIASDKLLFVAKAVHFYNKTLWEPAYADVFVTIRCDDIVLLLGEEKGRENGDVAEDELPARGILMRRENIAFLFSSWRRVLQRVAITKTVSAAR